MSILFSIVKCAVFAFNFISLLLGIGTVCVSALGLDSAKPGTDEHTYFIVGIILGSLVCMTTFFGCYGVVCESLGVNSIYAFFILIMLVIQFLQMHSYQHHIFYRNAMQRLEDAWRLLEKEPNVMQSLETNYHCCAMYSSRDYNLKGLAIPISCYRNGNDTKPGYLYERGCREVLHAFYEFAIHRENLFNWALMIAEAMDCFCAVLLSVLLYKQYCRRHLNMESVRGYVEPRMNHIDSRTNLLSN